jgi:KaiC/GvpD/RAD55 family RecA-like ATPase
VLEGGFPVGTTILVTGIPLSGVDLMARQFWQSEGEEGTYIMFDAEVEPGMVSGAGLVPDDLIPLLKGKRLVVDSISTLILQHGIEAGVNLILRARDLVLSEKANIMFVHYPDVLPQTAELRIIRSADVVIELKEVIFMNEIERQLAVHKLKGMAVPRRLIPFLINEKGIELSTTSRVV